MKALPAAFLSAAFCLVAGALEESPMAIYFTSEPLIASFDPIHETPVILILEVPLRKELLRRWRGLSPETDAGRRLKGLLLEDAGDPECQEWLRKNPGDKIRLLWKAGRKEEARRLWINWRGSRFEQAAAAILPVIAEGDPAEVARFRDFLLAPLPAEEVAQLCREAGLPDALFSKAAVKREWLKRFPHLATAEGNKLPDVVRLAIALESRRISATEFGEIREILTSRKRTRQERVQILEGLAGDPRYRITAQEITGILLSEWLESHPDEVAEVLNESTMRGFGHLAGYAGLPGIVSLRRELEQRPGNRTAALSLAIALRGRGEMPDEIAWAWRLAAAPEMNVPPDPPPTFLRTRLSAGGVEEMALEFAAKNLPERHREKWMDEWLAATPRSPGESARMAAWLALSTPFWEAWPEAAKIPGERRMLLECLANSRVGADRYAQRKAIDEIFAAFENEAEGNQLAAWSGAGTVIPRKYSRRRIMSSAWPGISHPHLLELHLVRYLMANALAVENPLRQPPRISGIEFERSGAIALHGYFASDPDHQGNGFFTPLIGRPSTGHLILPETPTASIDRWLAHVDSRRLSSKSRRSMEVMKIASCAPMDQQATDALRSKLQEWWEQDRDPDAGRMLLSFRRIKDRAPWIGCEGLWKEVAAAIPPHRRKLHAEQLADLVPDEQREAVGSLAGVVPDPSPEWMVPRLDPGNRNPLFPYWDTGWSEGFLGRQLWFSPWIAPEDKESLHMIQRARRRGLAAAEASGASQLDLAWNRATLFAAREEPAAVHTLLGSGRIPCDRALEIYGDLRKSRDKEGMRHCLDLLCDSRPDKAVPLLDDPELAGVFTLEDLEEWTLRALAAGGLNRERASPHFIGIMTRLAKSGREDGAARIAAAASIFSPKVLAVFPVGKKRKEYLAAWLTSKPEEIRPDFRGRSFASTDWKNLPELPQAEWEELATFLTEEERWEIRRTGSGHDFILLHVLLSAGVEKAEDFVKLGRMNSANMADLLGRAASTFLGRDDYPARIRALALDLARSAKAGEHSGPVLEMLAKYSAEDTEIASAFRTHARAYSGSPAEDVLKRVLLYGETGLAMEMAKRIPEQQEPADVILRRIRFFTEQGYQEEAWNLVTSRWTSIKKSVAKHPGYIPKLLPLARQAEDLEAVRYLIETSPDSKAKEIEESVKWLGDRKGN